MLTVDHAHWASFSPSQGSAHRPLKNPGLALLTHPQTLQPGIKRPSRPLLSPPQKVKQPCNPPLRTWNLLLDSQPRWTQQLNMPPKRNWKPQPQTNGSSRICSMMPKVAKCHHKPRVVTCHHNPLPKSLQRTLPKITWLVKCPQTHLPKKSRVVKCYHKRLPRMHQVVKWRHKPLP